MNKDKRDFTPSEEIQIGVDVQDALVKATGVNPYPFVLVFPTPDMQGTRILTNMHPRDMEGALGEAYAQAGRNSPSRAAFHDKETGVTEELDPRTLKPKNKRH